MKKSVLITLILSSAIFAKEGYMCSTYYESITRKVNIINSYGSDLSKMAEKKLYKDLEFETGHCISECQGKKFKFCNNIAKKIESY